MSDPRRKWNEKYRNAALSTPVRPAWVLQQHTDRLPLTGRALDLACGLGGNARYLAQCGLQVEAWDISDRALATLAQWARAFKHPVQTRVIDLNLTPWPGETFDVVVVSRWLDRNAWPHIRQRVAPGGVLFYQTFLAPVQENGPRNPEYYLNPGELVTVFADWRIEVHGEGWVTDTPDGTAQRQAWIIARRPSA